MKNVYVLNRGQFSAYVVVANDIYEAMERVEEEFFLASEEDDWKSYDLYEVIACGGEIR